MYIYKLTTLPDSSWCNASVLMKCGFYLKRALIIDEWPNRLRKPRD